MAIKCCIGCVIPKRYPGCHDHCEEYRREKEAHDRRKAELDQENRISAAIYINRGNKVEKVLRKRRTYKR